MNALTGSIDASFPADTDLADQALRLRRQLHVMTELFYAPTKTKELRRFSSFEAGKILGISDSRLRQLSLEGEGPPPQIGSGGRRFYTLQDLHDLRSYLDEHGRGGFVRHRKAGEHLQVISVINFKGGSAKTTTAVHLAQHLAMRGFRVLAVDLDPQASMTALLGIQPEIDVGGGQTLYGAIRYGAERRPLSEIIRPTYFPGLHIVPAHLELMEYEHETPLALTDKSSAEAPFFQRISGVLASVDDRYDVVIFDCPPQLGFLTLSALFAATTLLVTLHPAMLDVSSMSQFLTMTSDLLSSIEAQVGKITYDAVRYLITRYEPTDGPQTQVTGLLRSIFGPIIMTNAMVKSAAIADAALTKQTLFEVQRTSANRQTYDRAREALDAVNGEIESLILKNWGRA